MAVPGPRPLRPQPPASRLVGDEGHRQDLVGQRQSLHAGRGLTVEGPAHVTPRAATSANSGSGPSAPDGPAASASSSSRSTSSGQRLQDDSRLQAAGCEQPVELAHRRRLRTRLVAHDGGPRRPSSQRRAAVGPDRPAHARPAAPLARPCRGRIPRPAAGEHRFRGRLWTDGPRRDLCARQGRSPIRDLSRRIGDTPRPTLAPGDAGGHRAHRPDAGRWDAGVRAGRRSAT